MATPPRASTVEPPADAEFVLDDGLDEDDDEDMLAFQSTREAESEQEAMPKPAPIGRASTPKAPAPPKNPTPALTLALGPATFTDVQVEGLPQGCTRADLEGLVGVGALRGIKLGATSANGMYGPSILSLPSDVTAHVLALREPKVRGAVVKLSEVTFGVRLAKASESARAALADASSHLPLAQIAEAAGNVRNAFELAATDTRTKLEELDRKFDISSHTAAAASAAADAARKLDEAVGASRSASAVADAASVVAREVDENWRVSERARHAANAALADDRTAPAARAILAAVASPSSSKSRKEYTPTAPRRNPDIVTSTNDSRAALEF